MALLIVAGAIIFLLIILAANLSKPSGDQRRVENLRDKPSPNNRYSARK
jgi:hypothetical protein